MHFIHGCQEYIQPWTLLLVTELLNVVAVVVDVVSCRNSGDSERFFTSDTGPPRQPR